MKQFLFAALVGSSLLGLPLLSGCDSDKTTTKKEVETTGPNGASSVDKTKTTTDSNGNTTTSTEHKVTPPSSAP